MVMYMDECCREVLANYKKEQEERFGKQTCNHALADNGGVCYGCMLDKLDVSERKAVANYKEGLREKVQERINSYEEVKTTSDYMNAVKAEALMILKWLLKELE